MTHFLRDILRQPEELEHTIEYLCRPRGAPLDAAADSIRGARHVYLTGIGSSWHAALNVGAMLFAHGRPVYMQDAAELLQFARLPEKSVLIVISRSGQSIEIVQLLAKAGESGSTVIGITNAPNGTLAREAQFPIVVPVKLDHAISVNTYSTLALAAGILAGYVVGKFDAALASVLSKSLAEAGRAIPGWQEQIENSAWLRPGSTTYFLARGSSLGSAYEARLMWEEGVKFPATAMGAASFRHGPQEIVGLRPGERPPADNGARFGIWIDAARMREEDLALARDLRQLGALVMLIGQGLPADAAELVFSLPAIPGEWQFLIDIIPAQLTAERLARLSGADPDTFRLCSYIVEADAGLLPKG